ncbi:MAG TPA: helix-turn-helix domain-containing protein [Nocardioides sp.]|nr:helix-turn-helix domain-containing protein [Nocardioides sp.]
MSNDLLTLAWGVVLPVGPKALLVALADKANENGECWPSRPTLARMTGLAESSVSEHLGVLKAAGLVSQARRRHDSAVYTVDRDVLAKAQDVQISDLSNPDVSNPDVCDQDVSNPDYPESSAKTSGSQTSLPYTNHHEPTSANASANASPKKRKSKRADEYTDAFEAWWMLYPRKKDKFAAFRAFQAAIKKTSVEVLMAGARAYAAEVAGRADEHIKLGGTWLSKRCWESDAPVPVARTQTAAVEWVREQWRAAEVADIETATGLSYDQPDVPIDISGRDQVEEFLRQHRQQWITDNHTAIIDRLTRGIA